MIALKNLFSVGAIAAVSALAFPTSSASAQLTIIRNNLGGTPPSNSAGGGNLAQIFNEACDWWEAALVTTPAHTLTLNFQWGPFGGGTLAAHSLVSQGGTPNRETEGNITFDNDGSTVWFLDPTPCDPSEYTTFTTNTTNYGGGSMIDEAFWSGATGAASGRFDLMRTALHEVGHALGLSSANVAFQAERTDNDVDVTSPRPYAGSALPLSSSSAHLLGCNFLMGGGCAVTSQRRYPSEADILANAQISQWPGINFLTGCPGTGGGPVLTTTFAHNNGGSVGGAVYFSLEALAGSGGVTINDLDLNCDALIGTAVSIDVYVQPNGGSCSYDPAGVWVLRTSGAGIAAGSGNPTNFSLNTPIELGEGCCLGLAIVANGFGHDYTTGTTNPEIYANADLQLTAGAATNVPFTGNVFEPRIVNTNIHYTLGGACSDTAVAEEYGSGCVQTFTSFYEQLTQTGMDLSGLEIYGTAVPGGHVVNTRPATIQTVGSLGTPTALPLGDDSQLAAGTLGLYVGSNCWVARGPGNSTGWVPSVATMLGNPSEALYAWTDLQPNAAGSGQVFYEESGTQWMVTYDGVYLWSTTDPVTVQFRGNEANGNFIISFGSLGSSGPEDWLVGKSGAGASNDPGPRDLSVATPFGFQVADIDRLGLSLSAVNTPVLGQPFTLETGNIPSSAVFHVGIVGTQQFTLPLAFAFPSANLNCSLHASLDLILGPDVVFGGPGTQQWEGVDLTTVSALGASLYFQAATLDLTVLSDTTRTSNGVAITTGLY